MVDSRLSLARARSRIGRLNSDGSIDSSFDPGADNFVGTLAVQTDGKILVGGSFFHLGGGGTGTTSRTNIGRLNSDGSLDTDFDPGAGGIVYAIAVQADGRIVLGGAFITLGGGGTGTTPRFYIGRLNSDGSVDNSFNPGADNLVSAIALQADGKILVGGQFTTLGGGGIGTTPRNHIGRLDSDGTVDVTFDPGVSGTPAALVVQSDGKILVGGIFGFLGGGGSGTTGRNNIGRLNPDGTLDADFDPGANNTVSKLIVQPDNRILVGGDFTALGGGSTGTTTRNHIGRVLVGPPVITSPLTATATVNLPFSYQFETIGATSLAVDDLTLPQGLIFDPALRAIVGNSTIEGTFQIGLSATNSSGTTNATLTLTGQPFPAAGPVIISVTSATGRTGSPFSFQVITSGGSSAARLSATGLPPGLSIDSVTGEISGTVTTDGSFSVTLTATERA